MTTETIQQGIEEVIKRVDLLRRATAVRANGRFPFTIKSLQGETDLNYYRLSFELCPEDPLGTEFTIGIEKGCTVKRRLFKNPLRKDYICPIEGGIYTIREGRASMEYRIQQMTPELAIFRSRYCNPSQEIKDSISTTLISAPGDNTITPAHKEVWKARASKVEQPTAEDLYRLKSFLDESEPWARQMLGIEKHNTNVEYLLKPRTFYCPDMQKRQ